MKKYSLFLLATFVIVLQVVAFAQAESITVHHELGEVVVPKNPKNVVVFDYGILDALRMMEVEVKGLAKSNVPKYLEEFQGKQYVDVGTLFEPNFERIYELDPDVIFISGRQADQFGELNRIAPTVYLTIDAQDYARSVTNNLQLLGEIFGKEEFVETQLRELNDAFEEIQQQAVASGLRTLFLMVSEGTLNAYGPDSRFGVVHKEFGFVPADPQIEQANHGQNVSFEYLLKINPDLLLVLDRNAIVGGSISAQQVLDVSLVKMTKAVQNDRIIYLNSPVWYVATGGLEATWQMIADVRRALD